MQKSKNIRDELNVVFPNLNNDFIVTNRDCSACNCLSYVLDQPDKFIWPDEESLSGFTDFFKKHGYEKQITLDESFHKDKLKIALYGFTEGSGNAFKVKHANRQNLELNHWECIVGDGHLFHKKLAQLSGSIYGEVLAIFYQRL